MFPGELYAVFYPCLFREQGGWQHELASEQSFITVESQVVLGIRLETKVYEGTESIKSNKGNCSRFRELGPLNCSNQVGRGVGRLVCGNRQLNNVVLYLSFIV